MLIAKLRPELERSRYANRVFLPCFRFPEYIILTIDTQRYD